VDDRALLSRGFRGPSCRSTGLTERHVGSVDTNRHAAFRVTVDCVGGSLEAVQMTPCSTEHYAMRAYWGVASFTPVLHCIRTDGPVGVFEVSSSARRACLLAGHTPSIRPAVWCRLRDPPRVRQIASCFRGAGQRPQVT
jgi:hypothetical protein